MGASTNMDDVTNRIAVLLRIGLCAYLFAYAQQRRTSNRRLHVEMMGLIGMGNNPMVGATVACAVAVSEALGK